jgi:hypothetical protein
MELLDLPINTTVISARFLSAILTNSHFEGLCPSNSKAKHGKNKQYRNDSPQVAVGIAFDE